MTESEEEPYCCLACGARVGFGHAYLISFVDGRPSRCSKCPPEAWLPPAPAPVKLDSPAFRDPYPLVSRWRIALCVESTLLGLILPLVVTLQWWPWSLWGAALLVVGIAWTAKRYHEAKRYLDRRVQQAREGLRSLGDMQGDPELLERL